MNCQTVQAREAQHRPAQLAASLTSGITLSPTQSSRCSAQLHGDGSAGEGATGSTGGAGGDTGGNGADGSGGGEGGGGGGGGFLLWHEPSSTVAAESKFEAVGALHPRIRATHEPSSEEASGTKLSAAESVQPCTGSTQEPSYTYGGAVTRLRARNPYARHDHCIAAVGGAVVIIV